ncbi:MAG: proline--tRNA ligase [Desulfobacteraceae bacterium 4572_87]|nr:MAG: proline--tRNA ligase [Desulfobacteraceae bacterium 4572_87]
MRYSSYFIPTQKEAPADAEIISHQLMVRAGMIRKLTSGIYTYLPVGLRSIRKVEDIVREEMNRAGAIEVLMPSVQPAELWQESGRWEYYGRELLRFKDRHDREACMGPTHEEVITDLVRKEIHSYKQMPINLYQIQTKFRDEIRPRFGIMRGREFIMKDAYSFDVDEDGANKSYEAMYRAYERIFKRCGLKFRPVEADSGTIGGSHSHEFMVLAESGEDQIVNCTACDYAANLERAEVKETEVASPDTDGFEALGRVDTPDQRTIDEVAEFLKISSKQLVKTLVYRVDEEPVAVLIRGDHELNDAKLKNALDAQSVEMASERVVKEATGAPLGFAGPVGLKIKVVADNAVKAMKNFVVGGNEKDLHFQNANLDIGRTVAAAIEQNHDKDGIVFPVPVAPFEVTILPLQMHNEEVVAAASKIYDDLLSMGIDVLLDDRDERAGVKFKDADLLGIPVRVTVGSRGLKNGEVEVKLRPEPESFTAPLDHAATAISDTVKGL